MALQFITGNAGKFKEFQDLLSIPLEQLDIEVPEIQSLDPKEVIEQKLRAAREHAHGEYLVEDSSLTLDCLAGALPGPFIKWFEKALGNDGIANLAERCGQDGAEGKTLIGYSDAAGKEYFFEGTVRGRIVKPRGDKDFGHGPIFQPESSAKTYGEMEREEKYAVGSRAKALAKLREFLTSR
jgi:non-canonical purine NTP pyrophosphatase (RdgB/HAM1 family)